MKCTLLHEIKLLEKDEDLTPKDEKKLKALHAIKSSEKVFNEAIVILAKNEIDTKGTNV
jgi:hypothetical protein